MKLLQRFASVPRLISRRCTIDVFAIRDLIPVALCNFFFLALLANVRGAEPSPVAESKAKPPEWAYGTGPAEALRPASLNSSGGKTASENSRQHLPGSTLAFTRKEANDPFNPADWYPADHPEMPD